MSPTASTRIAPTRFEELCDRIQHELDDGLIGAAQVAVGLHGEVVAARSFGSATDDSRFLVYSATKPLVAMALLPHLADGQLDLTDPVARHLPEFGHHGKADVTVLQLLTMQGGFPQADMDTARWGTSEGRRSQFAEWGLAWPAGTRTEYHPMTAHFVVAELIETFAGRGFHEVVHDLVVAPAGVPHLLGPQVGEALPVRALGEYPADDPAGLVDTFGRSDLVPSATVTPDALLLLNIRELQLLGLPGGGAVASAVHMAAVYQHLLHNHGDALPAGWLADATGTIRNASINVSDGVPANRTIAGIVAGCDGYHLHRWFPPAPRAFGHTGAGGQLAWVDPHSGLSFAFLHDTLHQDPRVEFRRAAALNHLAMTLVSA